MLNPGANQHTGPTCGTKKCFIAAAAAGYITTKVNKDRANEQSIYLRCLWVAGSVTRGSDGFLSLAIYNNENLPYGITYLRSSFQILVLQNWQ